jgi:hypothetical protein
MNKLKETLSSRKFLVTVAGIIVVIGNNDFGLHLSNDSVLGVVTMIVSYVLGQSHVDAKKVSK